MVKSVVYVREEHIWVSIMVRKYMNRNLMKHKPKVPKVKIPNVDLKSFIVESLEIDPYWHDLYNPPPKKKNKYLN